MLRPSPRVRVLSAISLSVAVVGLGLVGPASADPDEPGVDDIDEVSERVERLWHEAEQAQERHHDAAIVLKDLRRELRGLRSDQARQGERASGVQSQVEQSIVDQYTAGAGVGTVGQVATSDDPGAFLSDLSTMESYNRIQDDLFDEYATELEALGLRETATADRADELAEVEERLRRDQETVEEKAAEAQGVLDDLEAEERAQLEEAQAEEAAASAEAPAEAPTASVPASGRAQAAVDYALAQVGDAYVYGASGPDAFDCSGLTSMAWAQAGVALPRSSGAQMAGGGAPVSMSDLQPGDLVFYYSPVSHVALYIGGGQIVHAANPGTGVAIAGVDSMPVAGAVRPG